MAEIEEIKSISNINIYRDGKNLKEKDPVLDTMISVIQVKISNQNPNHI